MSGAGCLSRTTRIAPPPPPVLTASLDDLLTRLEEFAGLQSMQATVDMQLSFLNEDRTKRTELTDVRGFVLAKRPGLSRIQAQYPVTRLKAFDMASDGNAFSVHLVWRNRFFQGETDLDVRSEKRAENIRPQHIVDPLLIEPPRDDEWATIVNDQERRRHYHVVLLQQRLQDRRLQVRRKVWFDRADMSMARLELFNEEGDRMTIANYSGWQEDNGIPYPTTVSISRPADGYSLTLEFIEPGLNAEVAEDAFNLEPPEGIEVELIQPEEDDAADDAARAVTP